MFAFVLLHTLHVLARISRHFPSRLLGLYYLVGSVSAAYAPTVSRVVLGGHLFLFHVPKFWQQPTTSCIGPIERI